MGKMEEKRKKKRRDTDSRLRKKEKGH